ncbi:ectoine hydroxylase-related dioxygenase (phytanoyl-CoA dioxygenase family) [Kribbella sp. VKM Ac-2569]|uniref:phytanoyl-CoA dioxygenase family protein n=1 Tax=Kribbella sp. VKM Ac-2569 TaxID=2512220 RepID=UPI00102BFA7E|nr:phytanoyl-CoA dioxygenase family protein [Kribbella sp. VKM Ac-2569]RZT13337.1 ectoine hydroxylase-related dioxygenase (phytanoyl-CoA dioxygenase family) [Kribbella sp. VKM Ac-2569]
MDMATALRDLGVTDDVLTQDEKDQLDRDGFLPLKGILTADEVAAINERLAELTAAEGDRAGLEVHQERGTDRLADLVNKDPRFEVCFSHPRVLAAMQHVLGEFKLSSLNSRAALPGEGHQGLHADFGHPVQPGEYEVCNSIWLLDDFTPSNGATRVVPGSHRRGTMPGDEMPNPGADHPDQIQLTGEAGTVVIFNSHLWHGGTQNHTNNPRRALHSYFARRHQPQQLDQQTYIRLNTYNRLTPAQHFILDVR